MLGGKKIAFFICRYSVDATVVNSALTLVSEGFSIDIFLYHATNADLVSFNEPRIKVYDLTEKDTPQSSKPTWGKRQITRIIPTSVRTQLKALRQYIITSGESPKNSVEPEFNFIPELIMKKAIAHIANERYLCFFGIESQGLIFAGWLGNKIGVPVVYYSLELFFSGNARYIHGLNFDLWKELEIKYHSRSVATIIQDEERAEILFENNKIPHHNVFFVPVALLGEPIRERHRYFHEHLNLNEDERILLHIGSTNRYRKSLQVVQGVQKLPPGWTVIMHGPIDESIREEIIRYDVGKRVILSTELLQYNQLQMLVSSADIGFVFYTDENYNEYTTGLASDKMARYMQCGLPVIVNNFPSFQRIIDKYRCGVSVTSPLEISNALPKIVANYDEYCEAAYACFIDQYEFKRHYKPVLAFLRRLLENM